MNLFERLILRRLMNVAGEGGEGGGEARDEEGRRLEMLWEVGAVRRSVLR